MFCLGICAQRLAKDFSFCLHDSDLAQTDIYTQRVVMKNIATVVEEGAVQIAWGSDRSRLCFYRLPVNQHVAVEEMGAGK